MLLFDAKICREFDIRFLIHQSIRQFLTYLLMPWQGIRSLPSSTEFPANKNENRQGIASFLLCGSLITSSRLTGKPSRIGEEMQVRLLPVCFVTRREF